jgi:general stress protein 26
MPTTISESEKRERLRKLMGDFDTAMLVTHLQDGTLRSRPLAIAEQAENGVLYFATSVESVKVQEIADDSHVNLAMQDKRRFVSITGRARVVDDRALVKRLWSEAWKVWFPRGQQDPSLRILVVEPAEASYWDASGIEGLKYLFESAKAYVTGTRPEGDQGHAAHLKP